MIKIFNISVIALVIIMMAGSQARRAENIVNNNDIFVQILPT